MRRCCTSLPVEDRSSRSSFDPDETFDPLYRIFEFAQRSEPSTRVAFLLKGIKSVAARLPVRDLDTE